MKTFLKSFSGAALATILILTTAALIIKQTNQEDLDSSKAAVLNEYQQPSVPVHRASYAVPQGIDFTEAAEKTVNAVVHITTEMRVKTSNYDDFFGPFRHYFGYPNRSNTYVAFGSGVIITPDGYIVTNNHVVEGADKITVTFNNKIELEATLVGNDPTTDLALVKVDAEDLVHLTYGNSDELKVGEWVLAVGNPFNLTSTVTAGIVSAKARNINILGAQSSIESFIQTDAVVNRGNSGGALVNINGDLVGINAAIASHTGVYEGYSFAIPANIVQKVVADLMNYGEIQRAYIGVQIRDINAEFADELGLDKIQGIYVASVVDDGGADDAGIREGDVIVSIDEKPINSVSELMGSIAQHNPGEVVMVTVNRDNALRSYDVMLKNQENNTGIIKTADSFYNDLLGATLQKANNNDLSKLGISSGLKVVEIDNGILRRGGISKGFIITQINGLDVSSETSLAKAINNSNNKSVSLRGMYPNGTRVSYEFML
jgi:Do/DeqQ family serine protease